MFDFLALLDIRVFGRLYLWILIGLALFYSQAVFVQHITAVCKYSKIDYIIITKKPYIKYEE